MGKPRDERQKDLFRPALEAIINLGHPLVRLAGEIDWNFLDGRFGSVCRAGPGQPPLPSRLVAGLLIVKHMHDLSDEALCARWIENPYYQYFCGEQTFRHDLPFDRSSLTRWRQRLGEEQLQALIQESLRVAHDTGAIQAKDLERVVVDTTVQPKAVAHPTDARLMHRALEKLVKLARREGVELRQSYARVAKRAAIMIGRYIHAHQFKRARRALRFLRARLGRVIRDIRRKTEGDAPLEVRFRSLLDLAVKVRLQDQHQRGQKVYSLHAPEVECIGKGKARKPYEFGVKSAVVVSHKHGLMLGARTFRGNPYDGHILSAALEQVTNLTQDLPVKLKHIVVDLGFRGVDADNPEKQIIHRGKFKSLSPQQKGWLRRRQAVEPAIGHLKSDHRMDRCWLQGALGDALHSISCAAGYNLRWLLRAIAGQQCADGLAGACA
jgi:IS5 family transposase